MFEFGIYCLVVWALGEERKNKSVYIPPKQDNTDQEEWDDYYYGTDDQ